MTKEKDYNTKFY